MRSVYSLYLVDMFLEERRIAMANMSLRKMAMLAAECVKNPDRPSFWREGEGRYVCPERQTAFPNTRAQALGDGYPESARVDPTFKLVFLTVVVGTLFFTLLCVTIHLVTRGELPPARKELSDGIFTMAKIGFGAIAGLLGGKSM